MRHIAAYLLLQLGGNDSPCAADVSKLLSTVGIESDSSRLEKLVSELEGKNSSDLINEGLGKLASVPSGGVSAAGGGGGGGGGAAAEAPKEEEKKEESGSESDDVSYLSSTRLIFIGYGIRIV